MSYVRIDVDFDAGVYTVQPTTDERSHTVKAPAIRNYDDEQQHSFKAKLQAEYQEKYPGLTVVLYD